MANPKTNSVQRCDVCGSVGDLAGVASSSLQPISLCFCNLCLKMGAEPKWIVEATIENCGGIEGITKDCPLIYYDKIVDEYISAWGFKTVPIEFKNGVSFNKRANALRRIKQMGECNE